MEYGRLYGDFCTHPRTVGLSNQAVGIWTRCLSWSFLRHETRGFLPRPVPFQFDRPDLDIGQVIAELEAADLWHPVEAGWCIRDWRERQADIDRMERLREVASRAGKASAEVRRRVHGTAQPAPSPKGRSKGRSATVPNGTSNGPERDVDIDEESISVSLRDTSPPSGATGAVVEVFETWREATGRNGRTVLTPTRRRVIAQALKSHGKQACLDAVRGWVNDPWAERPLHIDIDLLLRDAKQIEKFARLWTEGAPAPTIRREPSEKDRIAAWAAQGAMP